MWRRRKQKQSKKLVKLPTIIEEEPIPDVIIEEQQELSRVVCDICYKNYSKYYLKRHKKHVHGIKN